MSIKENIKRVTLVVLFNLRGSLMYLSFFMIQLIVIPLIVIGIVYLSIIISGGIMDFKIIMRIFLATTIASTIPAIAQLISNQLMPDVVDLNASLIGDIKLIIPTTMILNMLYILPQTVIVALIVKETYLTILALLAYLFAASLGTYVGVLFRNPMKANTIGTLAYLIFVMITPISTTSQEILWMLIPFSILNMQTALQVPYVIILSLILLLSLIHI